MYKLSLGKFSVGCLLFSMSVLAFPFYVFSGGSSAAGVIQPAHVLIITSSLFLLSAGRFKKLYRLKKTGSKNLLIFILYMLIVNATVAVANSDVSPIKYSAYYLYNFIVYLSAISFFLIATNAQFKRLFFALIATVFIQAVLLLFGIGKYDTYRAINYFDNPNQLGYFAISCGCLIYFINKIVLKKYNIYMYVGILISFYLVAGSLSNSALLAFGIFFVLIALELMYRLRVRQSMYLVAFIFLLVSLGYYLVEFQPALLEKLNIRLREFGGQKDDNFEGRGISKLADYYWYLVFGAGEGAFYRFYPDKEVHSTYLSIIFCYGLFGFFLLARHLYVTVLDQFFLKMVWLLPMLAYGLAHNGIRNPLFWILLGFTSVYVLREK